MQVDGLTGNHVNTLAERRLAVFADLYVIAAWTQVHRLVLVGGSRIGPIDEDLGVLYFRVHLDFAGVRVAVVAVRAPVGFPDRAVPTERVLRSTDNHRASDSRRSAHGRQRHQRHSQNQQSFFHFNLPS